MPVNFKGSMARVSQATFLKYSLTGLPFTSNFPEPGLMKTRATAFLRRPVPYNDFFPAPSMGCAVELNFPPQFPSTIFLSTVPTNCRTVSATFPVGRQHTPSRARKLDRPGVLGGCGRRATAAVAEEFAQRVAPNPSRPNTHAAS